MPGNTLHSSITPYRLQFKVPFETAHGRREGTDAVFVRLQGKGCTGYGEATLPPYLPYHTDNVMRWFQRHVAPTFVLPENPNEFLNQLPFDCPPARAAIDMAVWQCHMQLSGQSPAAAFGMTEQPKENVPHTFTIGVDTPDVVSGRVNDGMRSGFSMFKLKLSGQSDRETVVAYRNCCPLPFAVDVNQGWNDPARSLEMARWLAEQGCVLIEQPFPTSYLEWFAQLTGHTSIPVIADESCQHIADLESLAGKVDGINIKLQKCGGLAVAAAMIKRARELDMKVLIGCMSESSVGCNAAEWLAPWCDWADLDGPWLISNDPDPDGLFA
ncbi:MAG: dipeptide epimerase [Flavobacteriales bacterium]|nr:dipeptide epimerase [Flavobacteriales bacterium]